MRGLLKAAALLSPVYISASTVPGSPPSGSLNAPDYVIKYNESEASVVFRLSDHIAPGLAIPPLKFRVGSTKEPCGDSKIHLNSQPLSTEWDETHGLGSDFLEAFRFLPNVYTTWHIDCLWEGDSSASGLPNGNIPVQVARFGIYNQNEGRTETAGFAISFRSSETPEILRLVPVWTEDSDVLAHPDVWRTSSMTVAPQNTPLIEAQNSANDVAEQEPQTGEQQMGLKAHIGQVQSFLGTTFHKARKTFQSWCRKGEQSLLGAADDDTPSAPQHDTTTTPTIETTGTNPHALPTRSASPFSPAANSAVEPHEPVSAVSVPESADYTGLEIFGLLLALSSLIIWVILRLRDPRLRADRAARREERRNKRLYARAARQHKWKRWFCNWRHRNHRCTPVGTWDEKRARIVRQEEVLEEVMKEDILKLRSKHRIENNINAAEQGRSIYAYDSDGSTRRSREILPGYESEGTQPPSYETDVEGEMTRVADGFRYVPADREYSPDSSVISTSPRTSRDDRSSIFEKDIEPLNLGTTFAAV
ncbi:MAG: hypothetical protein Q9170_006266 [Blastenia crenularia]